MYSNVLLHSTSQRAENVLFVETEVNTVRQENKDGQSLTGKQTGKQYYFTF